MKYANLKIGDKIRIVNIPVNAIHKDTIHCFQRLIKRGYAQRIDQIDEFGCPWITCKFFLYGKWRIEWLAIYDDGSWVKVKKRVKQS